jgi:hypothetical protein
MPILSIIKICATLILCSCDRAPTAYQRLREETGASDQDLQQGILRTQDLRQKQVVAGDRGRSAEKSILGFHDFRSILTS